MIILGINSYHADSSAAILINGKIITAIEEERFKRVKHWSGFPIESIKYCLKEANIDIEQVDYISIGRNPNAKLLKKLFFVLKNIFQVKDLVINRFKNQLKINSTIEDLNKYDLKYPKSKIINVEHHRAHLASAYFASGFNESAILSIDGSGDFTTTMIAIGKNNKIKILDSLDFPVSCGLFYTAFTQYLGFHNYGDEYKIMGLAPYGKPIFYDKIMNIIKFTNNGLFDWDKSFFTNPNKIKLEYNNNTPTVSKLYNSKFDKYFNLERKSNDELLQSHKDLAASVQKVTEELIFHILNYLQNKTKLINICIAGGVAQNSVVNGKIIENTNFKNLYIPPAGHDAGISIGAALYTYNHILNYPRIDPMYNANIGTHFSNEEIEKLLIDKKIKYTKLNDDLLYDKIVDKLIEPGVVGWFVGKCEFGPRALGSRSILADPRNPNAKDLLNLKIKRRESFRPFAPSILKEYVEEFFEKNDNVPFMEKVFPIKYEKQKLIPAVTHVDGTGRLQTVDKSINNKYYQLIERFRLKTGIPILLNTSFNENEPIVNTPLEALDCFLRTNMDMLVLENFLIERN